MMRSWSPAAMKATSCEFERRARVAQRDQTELPAAATA